MGSRMSVVPICAIIDPSLQLDDRMHDRLRMDDDVDLAGGAPNSQCASITSRPLFISVAESIVIFGPICQVGCFSASFGGHLVETRRRPAAEGPARRREDQAPQLARPAAVQALVDGVVLAVDRQNRDAAAARRVHDETAGHHQHFLVGEANRLAGVDRREHGLERGRARRRAQHDIDVGMRRDGDEPVAARAVQPGSDPLSVSRTASSAAPDAIATARGR